MRAGSSDQEQGDELYCTHCHRPAVVDGACYFLAGDSRPFCSMRCANRSLSSPTDKKLHASIDRFALKTYPFKPVKQFGDDLADTIEGGAGRVVW